MRTDADGGAMDGGSPKEPQNAAPLACDGALCDTSNGAECSVPLRAFGQTPATFGWVGPLVTIVLVGVARRKSLLVRSIRPKRRPRNLVARVILIGVVVSRSCTAEPPPPVACVIRDPPPRRRLLAFELNPLPLVTLGKLSGNLVVVPTDHHALIVSPFYARTSTEPIYVYDDG